MENRFKPGDSCSYSFGCKNSSAAVVKVVRVLDNPRGLAEIRILNVISDDTANKYFTYLHKTGKTMSANFQYLAKV